MIQVMVFEPGKPGELREIDDTLEAMQAIVDGWIEEARLRDGIALICNEEGKLRGLRANRWGVVGTFFLANGSGEDLASLTPEQIRVIGELENADEQLVA